MPVRNTWTDEALRQRREEGTFNALEYIGVPKWLMPVLRAATRLGQKLTSR
jgi:hypothetical protein